MNALTAPTPLKDGKLARQLAGKYLTFILGEESYAVAVLTVREIIRMTAITPVPQMPAHVKGVINLRGKIVPILDLHLKLQLPRIEVTERTCIVVVQTPAPGSGVKTLVGLIVTAIEEVLQVSASDIDEVPDFGGQIETSHILGLINVKGRVKTLLDVDEVIRSEAPLPAPPICSD